jgi:hypothetical protein
MHRITTTTQTPGLWETAAAPAHARIAQLERELAEARERLEGVLAGQHANSAMAANGVLLAWAESLGLDADETLTVERLEALTLALRAALSVTP